MFHVRSDGGYYSKLLFKVKSYWFLFCLALYFFFCSPIRHQNITNWNTGISIRILKNTALKRKIQPYYIYFLNLSQSLMYLVALPTPILLMIPDCSILLIRFLTCFSVSTPLKVSISVLLLMLSWVLKHSLTFCNCCEVTPLILSLRGINCLYLSANE